MFKSKLLTHQFIYFTGNHFSYFLSKFTADNLRLDIQRHNVTTREVSDDRQSSLRLSDKRLLLIPRIEPHQSNEHLRNPEVIEDDTEQAQHEDLRVEPIVSDSRPRISERSVFAEINSQRRNIRNKYGDHEESLILFHPMIYPEKYESYKNNEGFGKCNARTFVLDGSNIAFAHGQVIQGFKPNEEYSIDRHCKLLLATCKCKLQLAECKLQ